METTRSLLAAIRGPHRGQGRGAEVRMPPFEGATAWLNSPPLGLPDVRGRVVVVDFWTYTCINWLRAMPYVRAWDAAYRSAGALVVGVHTPEFPFERDVGNIEREVRARGITYPVAVDSDYAIWTAFDNMYWPALYIADAEGYIRYHHFGEGAYEESEEVVRQLLVDAGVDDAIPEPVTVDARGVEAPADWDSLRSAETYLGYERTDGFASPGGAHLGVSRTYRLPDRLQLGQWALDGDWSVGQGRVTADAGGGRIAFRCHARDVHLVMGPAADTDHVRFRVLIDGRPPGADHGDDVDDDGRGTVSEQRLHQLVRQRRPVTDGTVEIEFLDRGVEAYSVTFG